MVEKSIMQKPSFTWNLWSPFWERASLSRTGISRDCKGHPRVAPALLCSSSSLALSIRSWVRQRLCQFCPFLLFSLRPVKLTCTHFWELRHDKSCKWFTLKWPLQGSREISWVSGAWSCTEAKTHRLSVSPLRAWAHVTALAAEPGHVIWWWC